MNEKITVSQPPLWHLKLARALFFILLVYFVCKTFLDIANVFYFASQPASAIRVSAEDSHYFFKGLTGYYRLSFDTLAMSGGIANDKLFAVSIAAAFLLFRSVPLLLMMNYGRRLMKTLKMSYTPFTAEAASYIKKAGILMICMGLLSKTLIQISMNMINLHRFYYVNPFEVSWILAGIFVLLLADIFVRGCYLQQESDETL